MIRALIVDDEPPARAQVREFLMDEPDVNVLGESGDGRSALEQIRRLDPDLVFMDIRMPRMSGLEVLQSEAKLPYTIFTTAYSDYAVEAFSVDALDYLVKPLERRRFRQAVERARRYLERDATLLRRIDPATLQAFLASISAASHRCDRLPVKIGRTTQIFDTDMIEFVEADGDYAAIHHKGGGLARTREGIATLETRLPAGRFVRIHRSLIVNLDCVREVRSNKHGGFSLVMASGHKLKSGAKYDDSLRKFVEN
ncbi:MAG: response regulator transcription factor [Xanthomonadales bacterium]|nr:response regulator transcription factor [Xanthomonadales bacterium]